MRSRILIIIAALVLGGFAAVMAASYLRSAQSDIAAENEPVEVLVAQQDLPKGMTGDELVRQKLVSIEKVPRQFVSADSVSSARTIEGQVLAVAVGTGEQLTANRFQYPADAGLAYSVPENYVAIAAEIDEVSGVGGLLKPSDNVMVYATLASQGDKREGQTMVIIPRARVLAVGTSVGVEGDPAEEDAKGKGALGGGGAKQQGVMPSTVTLALTPEDAARLVFSQESGSIRLALLPATASKVAVPSPVSMSAVAQ